MTTDRIFVLMLVIMIPMTGCFGAVDNADAQEGTPENTSDTIVHNHYYNNTTTIVDNSTTIVETPVLEKFTSGGMVDYNSDDYIDLGNAYIFSPYNFSTNAGEMVNIHYFMNDGFVNGDFISTVCDDGTEGRTNDFNYPDRYVWGSHASCVHTVQLTTYDLISHSDKYESGDWTMTWSLVYSIESVTVV